MALTPEPLPPEADVYSDSPVAAQVIPLAPEPNIYDQPDDWPLLGAMSVSHFFNDLCLSIAMPMIPTLMVKFEMSLAQIMGMFTITGLVLNFIQPFAGWMMERTRTPWVLLVCPFVCALTFWVGFCDSIWTALPLFCIAAVANGAFHPYAYTLAQPTLPRRPALATAIFISFGFLGVSTGALLSGNWMEHLGFGGFHWLYLGAFAVAVPLLMRGVHRLPLARYSAIRHAPHADAPKLAHRTEPPSVPFWLVFAATLVMAIEGGTLITYVPTLFENLYGSEGLGGTACFIYGVTGGIFSYLYAWGADRRGPFGVTMLGQLLAIPAFIGFFLFPQAWVKMILIMIAGMTAGATMPVLTSLARPATGLSLGLRTSLIMGGVWGSATIIHFIMAQIVDRGYTLASVMSPICLGPLVCIPLLALGARYARTGKAN